MPGFDAIIGAGVAVDDGWMNRIMRVRVVDGRLPDPTTEDEIVVNQAFSDSWDVGVGDTLSVVSYRPEELDPLARGRPIQPTGPRFALHVVGLVRRPERCRDPEPPGAGRRAMSA